MTPCRHPEEGDEAEGRGRPRSAESEEDEREEEKDGKGRQEDEDGAAAPLGPRKELDALNGGAGGSEEGSGSDAEERADMYEYEEGLPEEETGKNRRFDHVENLEYELPDDFKVRFLAGILRTPGSALVLGCHFQDEDLPSDEEAGSDADGSDRSEGGEEDDDRHLRMLQGITGIPGQAFQDKRKKLSSPMCMERTAGQQISAFRIYWILQQSQEEIESAGEEIRRCPGSASEGAIASEFQPRTEFEKKMALLVGNPEILEAHQKDGSRLLELNKISVEEVKDRQSRLAKMRSLLFRHEIKAKRMKKIKSKTYHRMMKKDRLKAASAEIEMDPEAIREQAIKQEFKRAEERMTLKHKNSSKWAKRIMKRGLNAQDEGTRTAIAEQIQQHALLTRKMNSMKDTSSSDDSSDDDEDDELPDETLSGGASKLLTRAKERTLKVIEEEDEMPKSGVLSLPFMVRGLKKKNEALLEEGRVAIQEYDSSLRQLDNGNKTSTSEVCVSGGRKVFGATSKEPPAKIDKVEFDAIGNSSDSEAEFNIEKSASAGDKESSPIPGVQLDTGLPKNAVVENKNAFENFDDINRETGSKTTYDVAIFVSDSFKKIDTKNKVDDTRRNSVTAPEDHSSSLQDLVAVHDSDMDSDEEMVDGFLSSDAKLKYELPSQADLVRSAFAGDDVEGDFEKQKLEVLDEEVPEPEKPVILPGWGEWTDVQQKKGLPKWMLNEHEDARRKREEALKKRKDAHLKHVIISEKFDKKADKLHTKTLPFPFTSKEVFEQSIRMPIGPEYNPAISHSALNRPAVVKRPGSIIKPIQFEEVDTHEKSSDVKQNRQKPKKNKAGGKPGKASLIKGKKAKV